MNLRARGETSAGSGAGNEPCGSLGAATSRRPRVRKAGRGMGGANVVSLPLLFTTRLNWQTSTHGHVHTDTHVHTRLPLSFSPITKVAILRAVPWNRSRPDGTRRHCTNDHTDSHYVLFLPLLMHIPYILIITSTATSVL